MKAILYSFFLFLLIISCQPKTNLVNDNLYMREQHRPQFHFSPMAHWMNDPNGMVYHNGEYHLFYQYYPDGNVWGPMHWGHAVSTDLTRWQHLDIALYPDSLGYIFSGSAVVDRNNTSGFGTKENPPLVAIYTYHHPEQEKEGRIDYQTQGIAYSNDNGRTWKKYDKNPVLKNPGIKDFRDPKVFWHGPTGQWIMILAVLDHVQLFRSPDLKQWEKVSEFGVDQGSHGGVWECPDLFPLVVDGKEKWVMLVSLNNGAPNGGSGTQYFIGSFDGKVFVNENPKEKILWIDFGTDNYAGVTWSDVPQHDGRRLFIGWMSNWNYANVVPTTVWRSAMTIPRELKLAQTPAGTRLVSVPVAELKGLRGKEQHWEDKEISAPLDLSNAITQTGLYEVIIDFNPGIKQGFALELSNGVGEKLFISFDKESNLLSIDRNQAGNHSFSEKFAGTHKAPREMEGAIQSLHLFVDHSSIELFIDNGLTVMTELMFPSEIFNRLTLHPDAKDSVNVKSISLYEINRIWP